MKRPQSEVERDVTVARHRLRELDAELDTYRTKCPTCRCRLLPGTVCRCCHEWACPAEDDQ